MAIKLGNNLDNDIFGTDTDDTIIAYGGKDYVDAGYGNDYISGGDGDDVLWGGGGNDNIFGGNDNDQLFGSHGDDHLDGGAGNDLLYGGVGQDVMTGGPGADKFVIGTGHFTNIPDSLPGDADFITDFSQAQGDKIDVSGIDANELLAGNQSFSFIGDDAFTGVAGQLRFEFVNMKPGYTDYTKILGDMDGDGVADVQINVAGWINFQASDFVL